MPPTSFHFDVGNSSTGPIGFCARVVAETREEALEILRDAVQESAKIPTYDERIEYVEVYFNQEQIVLGDSNPGMDEDPDDEDDDAADETGVSDADPAEEG